MRPVTAAGVAAVASFFNHVSGSLPLFHQSSYVRFEQLARSGLDYTHNDTIVRMSVLPEHTIAEPALLSDNDIGVIVVAGPFADHPSGEATPPSLHDGISRRMAAPAHSAPALFRGPLIGYSRSVSVCSSSNLDNEGDFRGATSVDSADSLLHAGQWVAAPSLSLDLTPQWLWVTNNTRVPVPELWQWLAADVDKDYSWSVRQGPPAALTNAAADVVLEKVASRAVNRLAAAAGVPDAVLDKLDASLRFTETEAVILGVPIGTGSSGSTHKFNAAGWEGLSLPCTPGSLRISLTEWSFPAEEFSIIARLALADDAWLRAALVKAAEAGVPGALDPPRSSVIIEPEAVVPGAGKWFTESAQDRPYYEAWKRDTNWFDNPVLTFHEKPFVTIKAKLQPRMPPSLDSIVRPLQPNCSDSRNGSGSGGGCLVWNLVQFHCSWTAHEYAKANFTALNPTITSYIFPDPSTLAIPGHPNLKAYMKLHTKIPKGGFHNPAHEFLVRRIFPIYIQWFGQRFGIAMFMTVGLACVLVAAMMEIGGSNCSRRNLQPSSSAGAGAPIATGSRRGMSMVPKAASSPSSFTSDDCQQDSSKRSIASPTSSYSSATAGIGSAITSGATATGPGQDAEAAAAASFVAGGRLHGFGSDGLRKR